MKADTLSADDVCIASICSDSNVVTKAETSSAWKTRRREQGLMPFVGAHVQKGAESLPWRMH